MNILEVMLAAQGGGATQQLGQQFGLNESQVSSAVSALVPALAAGFQRNMATPQGLESLVSALGGGQHQRYVEDPNVLGLPATRADGNSILGHVFGSKDASREVASRAAAQTGISEGVLKSMLPVVAAMMMGTMSRQSQAGRSRPASARAAARCSACSHRCSMRTGTARWWTTSSGCWAASPDAEGTAASHAATRPIEQNDRALNRQRRT